MLHARMTATCHSHDLDDGRMSSHSGWEDGNSPSSGRTGARRCNFGCVVPGRRLQRDLGQGNSALPCGVDPAAAPQVAARILLRCDPRLVWCGACGAMLVLHCTPGSRGLDSPAARAAPQPNGGPFWSALLRGGGGPPGGPAARGDPMNFARNPAPPSRPAPAPAPHGRGPARVPPRWRMHT
jgi:hypothetical protein